MSNQEKRLSTFSAKELEATMKGIINNKKPPIRNYKLAEECPTIDMSNISLGNHPNDCPCPIDFGVKFPEPQKQRALTAEDCNELFGVATAVKMNFIPQMITSLIMEQTTLLVNYCRENKIAEVKKHTRVLRLAVEEYSERLKEAYGSGAFAAYVYYVKRFNEEIATNVWLMEMHADALCRNQVPNKKHYPIFIRALVIVMLIRFCEGYDREMDKLIASKIGQPVTQTKDIYQQSILAVCLSLAGDLGYKINPDKIMGDWVRVLSNKAYHLADEILAEESAN